MLDLMRKNIELNHLQDKVTASIYDWGSSKPDDIATPDVLLAADCVYFEPAFPLLQQTMLDLIGDNTVCYFCFKRRRRADLNFVKVCKKLFTVEELEDPDRPTFSRENLFLLVILTLKSAIGLHFQIQDNKKVQIDISARNRHPGPSRSIHYRHTSSRHPD